MKFHAIWAKISLVFSPHMGAEREADKALNVHTIRYTSLHCAYTDPPHKQDVPSTSDVFDSPTVSVNFEQSIIGSHGCLRMMDRVPEVPHCLPIWSNPCHSQRFWVIWIIAEVACVPALCLPDAVDEGVVQEKDGVGWRLQKEIS